MTNVNPIRQEWTKKVIAEVGDLTDVWSVHFFPLPPSKALDPTSPYSEDEKEAFYEDLLATPTQLTKQFGDLRGWVEDARPGERFEYHLGSWAPIWSGPEDWTMNALPDGLWAADVFGTAANLGLDAAANWAMMNPYPPGKGDFGLWSPEGRQYVIADAAELWHRHFGTTLVKAESGDDLLSTYASLSEDREKLYVLLVNKRPDTAVETSFSLSGVRPRGDGAAWILDGPTNPDHLSDYGLRRESLEEVGREFTWTVPAYSAVALEIPVSRKAELDAAPDIAQDKFASASSVAFHDDDGEWRTDDFVADRAIDGDPTTRWASEAFLDQEQWFGVDLGQSQAFDRIELHWEYWSTGYTVEVSDDGESWRKVATTSDAVRLEPEPQPVERIDLASPVTARHVRVSMTGRPQVSGQKAGSSTWTPKAFSLWEFDVYLRP
ncbi:MAG TPA: discoidin domain-containing protein [Actinopolymorphaceae bacterium]